MGRSLYHQIEHHMETKFAASMLHTINTFKINNNLKYCQP
jgi:hypothetical protein